MEPEIWYEATSYGSIRQIAVVGETPRMVLLPNGRRQLKSSVYSQIFKSRDDAYHWVIEAQEKRIKRTQHNLEYEIKRLQEIKMAQTA